MPMQTITVSLARPDVQSALPQLIAQVAFLSLLPTVTDHAAAQERPISPYLLKEPAIVQLVDPIAMFAQVQPLVLHACHHLHKLLMDNVSAVPRIILTVPTTVFHAPLDAKLALQLLSVQAVSTPSFYRELSANLNATTVSLQLALSAKVAQQDVFHALKTSSAFIVLMVFTCIMEIAMLSALQEPLAIALLETGFVNLAISHARLV